MEASKKRRERDVEQTLAFIKVLLQERGDDPKSYSEKFLRDYAEKIVDGFRRDHPGELLFEKLKDDGSV